MTYDFNAFEKDAITLPRNLAWKNWAKFEKVGDKVQGYIRDVFYRAADGMFKEARGITLEQPNGELINVSIKRLPFILSDTNNLRLGDPLTVVFHEELPPTTKGYKPIKNFKFYGANIAETASNKTVAELEKIDMESQAVTNKNDLEALEEMAAPTEQHE